MRRELAVSLCRAAPCRTLDAALPAVPDQVRGDERLQLPRAAFTASESWSMPTAPAIKRSPAIQLGVPVSDALVRLRAHAFRTSRPLREVAADVVARRLRLEP